MKTIKNYGGRALFCICSVFFIVFLCLIEGTQTVRAAGYALCIGVQHVDPKAYEQWDGTLIAPENDANLMAGIVRQCGFNTDVLLTDKATRKAVLDALDAKARDLNEGDIFFLYFSGHGGQVPDINGDEVDSPYDSTWCLYDGQLIDDELYAEWRKFKPGVRVLVFSDSCHSGTIIKIADAMAADDAKLEAFSRNFNESSFSKAMPYSMAMKVYKKNQQFYDDIQKAIPRPGGPPIIQITVQSITACQDDQECFDGSPNGVFTEAVQLAWNNGAFNGDYDRFGKLIANIAKRKSPNQTATRFVIEKPDAPFEGQKPFTIAVPKKN